MGDVEGDAEQGFGSSVFCSESDGFDLPGTPESDASCDTEISDGDMGAGVDSGGSDQLVYRSLEIRFRYSFRKTKITSFRGRLRGYPKLFLGVFQRFSTGVIWRYLALSGVI